MAKPKTKGDPIQVRLPLDVDAAVRAKALERGVGVAEVVTSAVTRAVRAKVIPISGSGGVLPVTNFLDGHHHAKKTVNGAGLHVCECGAIRGMDEVWR